MMISAWMLWVWLADGTAGVTMIETEFACDAARSAIVREAAAAEHAGTCPWVVDAVCHPVLATPEALGE